MTPQQQADALLRQFQEARHDKNRTHCRFETENCSLRAASTMAPQERPGIKTAPARHESNPPRNETGSESVMTYDDMSRTEQRKIDVDNAIRDIFASLSTITEAMQDDETSDYVALSAEDLDEAQSMISMIAMRLHNRRVAA